MYRIKVLKSNSICTLAIFLYAYTICILVYKMLITSLIFNLILINFMEDLCYDFWNCNISGNIFILSIPIYLIEWILSKCNVKARDNSSKFIVSMGFRICLFIAGVKIEATGVENIPKDKACLYVGNHNSFFDILVSYVTIPYNVGYVAKKRLTKFHFLICG